MPKRQRFQFVVFIQPGGDRRPDGQAGTAGDARDEQKVQMTDPAAVRMPRPHPVPDGAFRSDDDVLFWSALGIHLLPRVDLVERD